MGTSAFGSVCIYLNISWVDVSFLVLLFDGVGLSYLFDSFMYYMCKQCITVKDAA